MRNGTFTDVWSIGRNGGAILHEGCSIIGADAANSECARFDSCCEVNETFRVSHVASELLVTIVDCQ